MALRGKRLPLAALVRRSPAAAGLLTALFVVLAVAALAAWQGDRHRASQAATPPIAELKKLPARPEDIEAHGPQAQSVLAPDDARARNAAVPFAEGPLAHARAFGFRGSDEDRARALECLATAILYEAGDDTEGEAAVAQVVLNRVRHPAFPATICGVVYQGAERATGCQFTFTCDGSLRRAMPDAAWRRARMVAAAALGGKVYRAVGLATHYHTDWVYPYWSPELRKLARVGTHLFFGWPGGWGGPAAFRREYRGGELAVGALTGAVPAAVDIEPGPPRILGLPQPPARLPPGLSQVPLHGSRVRLVRPDGRAFGLLAPAGASAASLAAAARGLCQEPGACQVAAWANEDDIPGEYPIPEGARGTMIFEYVRDGAGSQGTQRFDCRRFPNKDPKRCLPASALANDVLPGIRWKSP